MHKADKKRKKKSTHTSGEHRAPASLFQSALFGSLCGLICSAALLFLVSFVCYRSPDPDSLILPLSLGALYLSCLVGGFAAVKRQRASALLCGGMAGLFLGAFFLVLSLFLRSSQQDSFSLTLSILLRVLMLPASSIGGFLGLGRPRKRHS